MSVTAYFAKYRPDPKMNRGHSGVDRVGIAYCGPVLSGSLAVRHGLELKAVNSPAAGEQICRIAPGGLGYQEPPAPDPGYRDPRLDPDRLLAAQRDASLSRGEPYDPVLRFHLGLPLLPDPYAPTRRIAVRLNNPPRGRVTP